MRGRQIDRRRHPSPSCGQRQRSDRRVESRRRLVKSTIVCNFTTRDYRAACGLCAGVLVDHTDNDLMSAFRFMMQQHNSKQSRLKVTDETLMLPMDNSFSVGTASTYTLLVRVYNFRQVAESLWEVVSGEVFPPQCYSNMAFRSTAFVSLQIDADSTNPNSSVALGRAAHA